MPTPHEKAAQLLKGMSNVAVTEATPPPKVVPITPAPEVRPEVPAASKKARKGMVSREERKQLVHFGGYLDEPTMETVALLRLRLKVDNSQLIKLAIEELSRSHRAKKAFGDA